MEDLSQKVYFSSLKDLITVHNSFPELLLKAHSINGVFDKHVNDSKTDDLSVLTRRNLTYGNLELRNYGIDFSTSKKLPKNFIAHFNENSYK